MAYTKQVNDKAFRRINLKLSVIPDFQEFSTAAQGLEFHEDEVLEVQKDDGSTVVIENSNKSPAPFRRGTDNSLYIAKSVPTAHLGVCNPEKPCVRYMLPELLPEETGYKKLMITAYRATLCGDKYFNAAYQLINQN